MTKKEALSMTLRAFVFSWIKHHIAEHPNYHKEDVTRLRRDLKTKFNVSQS